MGFLARIVISAHFRSTANTASIMSPSMRERSYVVENRWEIFFKRAWRVLQFVSLVHCANLSRQCRDMHEALEGYPKSRIR
jgi:hypothetical protein